jgi:protein MpaA
VFHGDEILSGELASRFSEYLFDEMRPSLECRVILVPVVNPDGLVHSRRTNARGVDINRNFPTENWSSEYPSKNNFPGERPSSEPETRAVIRLLEEYPPDRIVSIHTPLSVVNYDGPAADLAERMSRWNGYAVQKNIGYPTPGSFGSYAGIEKNIPTITLELAEESFETVWNKNRNALLESLKY